MSALFTAGIFQGPPGGTLETYAAGTLTPLATYTDRSEDTPNATTIELDAEGYADVWIGSGLSYRMRCYDADGALKWDTDNITGDLATATCSASNLGVIGGGINDDAAAFAAAFTAAKAAGYRAIVLDNPDGYKINSTVVQPYDLEIVGNRCLIRCEGIAPGAGTPAWRVAYASWATNSDRFAFRKPLTDVIFRGHATPADSTYTTNLHGVQMEAYHQVLSNVVCVGFDRGFTFAESSGVYNGWLTWETKFRDCAAVYCKHGLYCDVTTAGGGAGAGITWTGGAMVHCDYSVFNAYGEITLLDAASDAPLIAHVKDNLSILSGNEFGFLHWQNSRIEAGGAPGTPWITNSGMMRLSDCFIVERNGAEFIFNTSASGYTVIDGGTWRTSDGRYKATGLGVVTQRGVRPINDSNGVLLKYENSGVLNGDLSDTTTTGFVASSGTVALTNVVDASFLAAGRALNIVASGFPATVATSPIELDPGSSNFVLTFRGSNANGTLVPVTVRQYNRGGAQVSSASVNISTGGVSAAYSIKHRRFPNSSYLLVEIGFVGGQTSAVRVSDFYLTQW